MPKKTRSKIYETFPVRSEKGDEEFAFVPVKSRELPARLRKPISVNAEAQALRVMKAPNKVSRMQVEIEFATRLHKEISQRWQNALQCFDAKDNSMESWRGVALNLMREFIPGLSVEYVSQAEAKPRVMTEEHIYAVVDHVDEVLKTLQDGKSAKSAKVLQRNALRHVYKNWPEHLGRKRSTFQSWETHYHQCMKEHAQLSISLLKLSNLLQSPGNGKM
jgi:hypothetical protein